VPVQDNEWSLGEVQQDIYILLRVPEDTSRTLEKLVFGFLSVMERPWFWTDGFYTAVVAREYVREMIKDVMKVDIIGRVAWFARDDSPAGWLALDGATHGKADYPELYDALSDSLKDTVNEEFTLPDMKEKYFSGKPSASDIGDEVGENSVALTESELASHSHGVSAAISSTPVTLGPSPPVATATSTQTGSAGSGQAHENRPKTVYMRAFIFAGR
jgi:microcystin-dependent protein